MIAVFSKIKLKVLAVIIMTAVLLIVIVWGVLRGKVLSDAKSVYITASEIEIGLGSFFKDNDRFPIQEEFEDTNLLLTYFASLPDNTSDNSLCPQNFVYKRLSTKSYQLDFCLADSVEGFKKGWNKITVQK